jgi:CubicO group peptidase (beta-lactamase class C family)
MRLSLPILLALALAPILARADEPKVSDSLRPFVDRGVLAGAVTLVATPERVLSLEAVGYSDVAAKVPMKVDSLFWIASMNKPITATALMMLVDEGKVKLDDPVEAYLPEFKGQMVVALKEGNVVVLKKPARPITVRNILSHTAGLVGQSPLERELDTVPLRELTLAYGLLPLQFEPGSRWLYNNPGINTAGRIIEAVSGMPYEEFLKKRFFEPLGMKDTTFWPTEEQVKRLAKSYKPDAARKGLEETRITQLTYPLTDRKRHPYPAGGLFSTAADLGAFCRMILNGGTLDGRRYLSEAAVREMTSTQTGDLLSKGQGENGFGLGWMTSKKSTGDSGPAIPGPCGHGGAYATNMSIDPGRGLITVYLVQHAGWPGVDGGAVLGAFQKAAAEQYGKKPEARP